MLTAASSMELCDAPDAAPLRVGIVLPTRNRAGHAKDCVQSILANEGFSELIVVDQSDASATQEALSTIRDPRLRYIRTPTRGVSLGRNIGIEQSGGDIVAFTDDDCRVSRDWVGQMTRVFASDPDIAVVCGRVVVPEELRERGHAESFEPHQRVWKGRYPRLGEDWGLTANMGIRRAFLGRIGLFDPMLGVGAPLRSGGEPDLIFRALRAGLTVVNASEVVVAHLGVRAPGAESRQLILGYGAGTAAAIFKHARLGDPAGVAVYARFLGKTLTRVCRNVLSGRRPTGASYLTAFLSGTLASFQFRIDRERRQYVRRDSAPAP